MILSLSPLAAQVPRAGQRGYNPVKVIEGQTIHDSDGDNWDDLWLLQYEWPHGGGPSNLLKEPNADYDNDGVRNYREMLARTDPWPAWQRPVLTPEQIVRNREIAAITNEQSRAEAVRIARLINEGRATSAAAEAESRLRPFHETAQTLPPATDEAKVGAYNARKERRKQRNLERQAAFRRALTVEQEQLGAPPGSGLHLRSIRPGMVEVDMAFNLTGARSIRAANLWPASVGGPPIGTSALPDVTGAGQIIGLWEPGGGVMPAHSELGAARVDTTMDNPILNGLPPYQFHATGVAAIAIGAGNQSIARGTAYGAHIESYDTVSDYEEMDDAAQAGMQVSNHSYGQVGGWTRQPRSFGTNGEITITWRWWGRATGLEDAGWGMYERHARSLDLVTNDNPYYLPVYAAGNYNQQTQLGPVDATAGTILPQTLYYRIHDDNPPYGQLEVTAYSTTTHPVFPGQTVAMHQPNGGDPLSGALTPSPEPSATGYMVALSDVEPKRGTGHDTIRGAQLAKNSLTVGAVEDLETGVISAGGVKSAIFSSRGPTDDGRIKPDIVANGTTFTSANVALQSITNLPANPGFEMTVLTNNTATNIIEGWAQDAGANAAELRRDPNGISANGFNHLVVKTTNHRVWQDFGAGEADPEIRARS